MPQKIAIRLGFKQVFLICIATIICIATLGLGFGLSFGTGSRNDISVEALQNENRVLPHGVTQVSAGSEHTMAIDSQGNLWAFGHSNYGQLGNMSTDNSSSSPINITVQAGNPLNGKQIVQVSACLYYTMAIDAQGNLWAFGRNNSGQFGNMSTSDSGTPINITAQSGNPLFGKQIVQVSAGGAGNSVSHTMAIDAQGNLWAFGAGGSGQLGNMDTTNSSTPINITAQVGNPLNGKQIVQVSASGYGHTMAIDAQGNLWAFGAGENGQLGEFAAAKNSTPMNITAQPGNPLNGKQIMQVSAGGLHTMAIDSTGTLWAFGYNYTGQLGNMTSGTSTNHTPINITAQVGNPLNSKQIIQVAAGGNTTMVIDSTGNLWAFGTGGSGQLGNMDTAHSSTPINITAQVGNPLNSKQIMQVATGWSHTMTIDSMGNLWSFGSNGWRQLGNGSSTNSSTPINITAQAGNPLNQSQFGRMQVLSGDYQSMVIDNQGGLWAFGNNSFGQLGNMSTTSCSTPINITTQPGNSLNGKQIIQVSTGYSHTMAIDSQGNLWAFGDEYNGQLGNMSTTEVNSTPINITAQPGNPLNGKQIVQVSAGTYYTMAIDSQSNLWAFGNNQYGQLGNMSNTTSSTPVNITSQAGNPLNGKQIVQVSVKGAHTVAIDSTGQLWSFGSSQYGQLGNISTSNRSTPINLSAPHNATTNPSGANNPLLNKQFIQVSAGYSYTMAIDSQGGLWAFGYGSSGRLGNMSTAATNSTPINITAQAGNPLNGKQIVQVSAGIHHTMGIDSKGNLWAFGQNTDGRLGNLSTDDSSIPINLSAQSGNPLLNKQFIQVSAGGGHTTAIDSNGNIWAFGNNNLGQLGNMSTNATNSTPINISMLASTYATIFGNPNACTSVRTNFTTGWGTTTASGGTFTNWTSETLSSPVITKNDSTQTGRVRYEFDAGKYNTITGLSINDIPVTDTSVYSSLKLFNDTIYLRILTSGTITIIEIDRINTKLFVPVTISAITTRNVGHSFKFSDTSHLSSRMSVDFGEETTSLSHTFVPNSWDGTTASVTQTAFTFTSRASFAKITISRPTMSDVVITNIVNQTISVAGLSGTLFYSTGSINTIAITLSGMQEYDYTWTIETQQIIQVQQILNPPAGAASIADPAFLTLNSSSGANWADLALAAPANQFGKTFQGWYTHPDYLKGTLITTATDLQQHITATGGAIVFLYARWA